VGMKKRNLLLYIALIIDIVEEVYEIAGNMYVKDRLNDAITLLYDLKHKIDFEEASLD
jgi:hypothetical protein